jgi:glycosyltransferase involved in cell wall biosynthesis
MKEKIANGQPPLLSIITVCLNEPKLERTCESIVNQTFQDFEWIVIDGGSNEETLAIFEKYKSRMNFFVSEPDGGIYFGMNKGIVRATGEWLNFMNAGDMYANHKILENIFTSGDNFDDIDVLYGHTYSEKKCVYMVRSHIDKITLYQNTLPHQAAFIRRKKNIKFDVSYNVVADWHLFVNIYNNGGRFKQLDLIVSVNDNSGISSDIDSVQFIEERRRLRSECFSNDEIYHGNEYIKSIYRKFIIKKRKTLHL